MEKATVHDLAEARAAEDRRKRMAELDPKLARNDKGAILGTVSNLILIVGHDPNLSEICGFDEFTSMAVLHSAAPVPIEGAPPAPGPYPRPWVASDVAYVQSYIQRIWTKNAGRQDVDDAMGAVAALRRFHPVRDWIGSLKWDGKPRIDTWMANAFGAPDDDYHAAIGAKFLIAAVRRVRRPGCKFDHMVIFEGLQSIGKSTALCALFGEAWFTDALPAALETRDAALGLQGVWCIEFGEIEQIIRTEVEVIKAFLARSVDRFRAPYGRSFLVYPRQCVMVGTTNDEEYLRDTTGNRRFWPVKCQWADPGWISENREQLFAEAAARESAGETHWLDDAEVILEATRAQAARLQVDVWLERVITYVKGRRTVCTPEILEHALMVPVERQGKREEMRVAGILRTLGWTRMAPTWSAELQKVVRGWDAPER